MSLSALQPAELVKDPGSIRLLRERLTAGTLTPRDLVAQSLARIAATDHAVQAWCGVDGEAALAAAERLAAAPMDRPHGELHGIPFAVKDVLDVEGWPTRAGSRTRRDAAPARLDATVVARARAAGAILIGKTHTTEFAYFDGPPPTRNPWNLAHTPGGSSSGSAAAVAAGAVPFALATQTAGSINRPAAYCGIAAFRPSTASMPGFGVTPFAPSFDTAGILAYRVADAVAVFRALAPDHLAVGHAAPAPSSALRITALLDPLLDHASDEALRHHERALGRLRAAGHAVESIAADPPFERLLALHRTVSEYELGHIHHYLLEGPAEQVSSALREAIERGLRITSAFYVAAQRELADLRRAFWRRFSRRDLILFPATPDAAPPGMGTGDPRFIIPLTALGGPLVTVPIALGAAHLPLGLLAGAAPGRDLALAAHALAIAPIVELAR